MSDDPDDPNPSPSPSPSASPHGVWHEGVPCAVTLRIAGRRCGASACGRPATFFVLDADMRVLFCCSKHAQIVVDELGEVAASGRSLYVSGDLADDVERAARKRLNPPGRRS